MKGNSRFIGITSGCGGVGTSSLAIAMGRILSRINQMNVIYVSFDILGTKCEIPGGLTRREFYDYYVKTVENGENESIVDLSEETVKDSYGLNYLKVDDCVNPVRTGISEIDSFLIACNLTYDAVILDVPCNSMAGISVFHLCEDIIVNEGICDSYRKRYCDDCESLLRILAPSSRLTRFSAGLDNASFDEGDVDIHGEFGSEVRVLVEKLGL